jgi:hypothetical protein
MAALSTMALLGLAGVGGALAAKKFGPKPKPVDAAAVTAPQMPPPPNTALLESNAQAQAIQAATRRRKQAVGDGVLGPRPLANPDRQSSVQRPNLIGRNAGGPASILPSVLRRPMGPASREWRY